MNLPLPDSENVLSSKFPSSRRGFLRRAGLAGVAAAIAPAAASMLGSSTAEAASSKKLVDADVLNFALNLEYLEAEFYALAVFGQTIQQLGVGITGTGAGGTTFFKNNPKVNFVNPLVANYAAEIAADEIAHVVFLRAALGSAAIAKPAIDLQSAFDALAVAAGLGTSFDPFASDGNFLLGGFIFEDVGVTAYHGAAPLLKSKDYLTAAAGILAVEAYHAAILRSALYTLNSNDRTQFLGIAANAISDTRDALAQGGDKDQGITTATGAANLVPTDGNALAFARTTTEVLHIVYGSKTALKGGFFPNGVNGNITL